MQLDTIKKYYFDVNTSCKSGCQFEKLSVMKIGKILEGYKMLRY
jgi:hypothetical protein